MSYTSVLFGVNVSEQSQYLALRDEYQKIPYPNMGRYFHSQGYEYVWVVPIDRELPPKYQEADHAFYGADRWVTFNTLDYDGPMYGWGPSPPDQYTLGFIQELVHEGGGKGFVARQCLERAGGDQNGTDGRRQRRCRQSDGNDGSPQGNTAHGQLVARQCFRG